MIHKVFLKLYDVFKCNSVICQLENTFNYEIGNLCKHIECRSW